MAADMAADTDSADTGSAADMDSAADTGSADIHIVHIHPGILRSDSAADMDSVADMGSADMDSADIRYQCGLHYLLP